MSFIKKTTKGDFGPLFFSIQMLSFPKQMINKDASYKEREIIMDTWPQLYWLKQSKEKTNDNKYTKITKKGVV